MADDLRERAITAACEGLGPGARQVMGDIVDAVLAVVQEQVRQRVGGPEDVTWDHLLTHVLWQSQEHIRTVQELRGLRTVVARVVRQGGGVAQLREHLATMPANGWDPALDDMVRRIAETPVSEARGFAPGGVIHTPSPEPVAHHVSCERRAFHDPGVTACTWRERPCVEAWPGCESGAYDPACCRFPKSCSVDDVPVPTTPEAGQ